MLDRLNEINDMKIYSVFDDEFKSYGKVIEGYDMSELREYMLSNTPIPEDGNIYVASDSVLESFPVAKEIAMNLYGSMPIQIGYCNGKNSNYNAFEYHKGSEYNVAITPFCLVLGHIWEIEDNKYYVGNEKVFYVPEATVLEMYATTLHFSPCRVCDEGFKNIIILPKGTNTPIENKPDFQAGEERLILQRNKWLIAHPEREPLMKQGAFPGLIGENKSIKY